MMEEVRLATVASDWDFLHGIFPTLKVRELFF